jgi:hypothetical protein
MLYRTNNIKMASDKNRVTKFDAGVFDKKKLEADGKRIYQSNDFFRSLANLMEHPEFKPVFKKHFNSWDDIKLFVMFLKVYDRIGDQFPDFTGYHKLSLVKTLIDTSKSRRLICREITQTYNKSLTQSPSKSPIVEKITESTIKQITKRRTNH